MATTKKNARAEDPFKRIRIAIWGALTFFAMSTALMITFTFPWASASEPDFVFIDLFPQDSLLNAAVVVVHVLTAIPPLVIGPWLFVRELLKSRWRRLHVWFGIAYVYCIFTSSVFGFILAMGNRQGFWAKWGFGTLAIVWFTTTWRAYSTAREKDWILHREWMVRSFMTTMAVVTVRLLPSHGTDGFAAYYPLMTWACWVPNVVLAETYVRLTDFRGRIDPTGRKALREKRAERRTRRMQDARAASAEADATSSVV